MKNKPNCKWVCLLCALLLCLAACGQTEAAAEGIPSAEEMAKYEALYEKGPEDVKAGLKLADKDYEAVEADSLWQLTAKRTIGGEEFTQSLLFVCGEPETLYGVKYEAVSEAGIAQETMRSIYEDTVAAYGEPGTYVGLSNRISEKLLDGAVPDGLFDMYSEQWTVGERTELTMRVTASGGKIVVITLSYQMAAAG